MSRSTFCYGCGCVHAESGLVEVSVNPHSADDSETPELSVWVCEKCSERVRKALGALSEHRSPMLVPEVDVLRSEVRELREAVAFFLGYSPPGWPGWPVNIKTPYGFRGVAQKHSEAVQRAAAEFDQARRGK